MSDGSGNAGQIEIEGSTSSLSVKTFCYKASIKFSIVFKEQKEQKQLQSHGEANTIYVWSKHQPLVIQQEKIFNRRQNKLLRNAEDDDRIFDKTVICLHWL